MDLRRKVLSGLGWSAGARFLSQLVTWAITLVVIRLLTPADYGLMALAGMFVFFFALLNELGMGAALVQKQTLDEFLLQQVFGLLLLINFCFFLLLSFSSPLIALFFNEPRLSSIIRVLSLQFLLMGFSTIPQSILMRKMDFKAISIADFTSAIAGSIATLIMALLGYGVWSLVIGMLLTSIWRTIYLNITFPYLHFPRLSFINMSRVISFGGYVTINRVFWFIFIQADIFIIGKTLGKELLGFYSVASEIASLPMQKISGIISQVAFPAYSSVQNDLEKAKSHFLKSIRIMSFFAFPVLWGISSIAPEIVALLLGDKWQLSALPIQLLSLIIPLRMISVLFDPTANGLGRPDISFFIILFSSIAMPAAILIGINWGLVGVCSAWVSVYPLVFLYNLSRILPFLGIRFYDFLISIARPVIASFIMYVTVMGCKTMLGDTNSVLNLLLLIVAGTAVYCGTIITLHKEGYREVVGLIKA
jgi:O-antigen/teichoic acid export membrane protein